MTNETCLHCSTKLTAKDLSEGWCDSCGKRIPTMTAPAKKPKAAPAAVPQDESTGISGVVVWSTGAVIALTLGALALLASQAWAG